MKGGGDIRGSVLRVALTSSPHMNTRSIEGGLVSGEILLQVQEEVKKSKEGVWQEYTVIKGVPSEVGCYLTLASVYCPHLSYKPGTLFLSGGLFTMTALDSIKISPYNTSFSCPPSLRYLENPAMKQVG